MTKPLTYEEMLDIANQRERENMTDFLKQETDEIIVHKFQEWFHGFYGRFSFRSEWFYEDCDISDLKQRENIMEQWILEAFIAGYNSNELPLK